MQTASQIIIQQQQDEHRRQGTYGKTHVSLSDIQEYDQIDHVYNRPDTYLGSAEKLIRKSRVLQDDGKIGIREVSHPRAMEQTFYEILGNVGDIVWKSKVHGLDPKQIEIQMTNQWCSVKNYGMYITHDVKENGMSTVEWLFGVFMVSTNYDDTEKRFNIGRNGYGAKLTNVMSNMFVVRSVDPTRKQLCTVVWRNHMKEHDPPVYEPYTGDTFTEIQFSLDFQRFGYTEYDAEAMSIYAALAAEMSFAAEIPVKFNQLTFDIKNIKDYANYYFDLKKHGHLMYTDPQGSYDICLVDTPGEAIRHTMVNGILTVRGGVHVEEAYREVLRCINSIMEKHIQGVKLTIKDVSSHVSLFLICRLPNPVFDGQTKDCLSKPSPKINIPEKIIRKIEKWDLVKEIYETVQQRQLNKLKKTDGRKNKGKHIRFKDNEGFQDANLAGKSKDTVLVLCEGQSGIGFYTRWINNVPQHKGRDYYGILPLKGKPLNVLKAKFTKILENHEIMQIKGALGLGEGDNTMDLNVLNKLLRYFTVLLMPDADEDGKHILGLLLAFFCARHPGLVVHRMIKFLRIPIVFMRKSGVTATCYTNQAFEDWKLQTPGWNTWKIDYFKGLASYKQEHIDQEFRQPKVVSFYMDENSIHKVAVAFTNEHIAERKAWLLNWMTTISPNIEHCVELSVGQCIDYELPPYIVESIYRAIPDVYSGFKDSQQKVWYCTMRAFGKNDSKYKIEQLANHVAKVTDYKHGGVSLINTIVHMAFDFPGTNNMPYLTGEGSVGDRYNGKDGAGHARYIFVTAPWWTKYIYHSDDTLIMKELPKIRDKLPGYERYYPIIPMHLVNGVLGIATTVSTRIPPHHPLDLAFWLEQRILHLLQPEVGHTIPQIHPYHYGFKGRIRLRGNQYITMGIFEDLGHKIVVTELPIGESGKNYYDRLVLLEEDDVLKFSDNSNLNDILFTITNYTGGRNYKDLGLLKQYSYNNMTVIIPHGESFVTKTYNNLQDMLEEFFQLRLVKYGERIQAMLAKLQTTILDYEERLRFIRAVNAEELIIIKRKKVDLHADMNKMGFDLKLLKKVSSDEYTNESVEHLLEEIQKLLDQINILKATHPAQMWYADLEAFIEAYTKKEKVPRTTFDNYHRPNVQVETIPAKNVRLAKVIVDE